MVNIGLLLSGAILCYLFYVLHTHKETVADYVGKVACIHSFVMLSIPALFTFIGIWEEELTRKIWFVVLLISVFYFVSCGFKLCIKL